MLNNITESQWKYLGGPESICILRFENENVFKEALYWADIIWVILREDLYVDIQEENKIVPWTMVIPDNMLEKFCHPHRGMVGKFKVERLSV